MNTTTFGTLIRDPVDMVAAAPSSTSDGIYVTQGGKSRIAPFGTLQFYLEPPAIPVNSNHTVGGIECRFIIDASVNSVTITLPDLASWGGGKLRFRNMGPSGMFSVATAGSDVIINPATGANVSTFTSGGRGTSFSLEPERTPASPPSGWAGAQAWVVTDA